MSIMIGSVLYAGNAFAQPPHDMTLKHIVIAMENQCMLAEMGLMLNGCLRKRISGTSVLFVHVLDDIRW